LRSSAEIAGYPARAQNWMPRENARAAGWFAASILVASLFLQRFAIPFGALGIGIVGPLGLLLAVGALYRGALVFDRARLALFAGLTSWLVIGMAHQAMTPNGYRVAPVTNSLLQFLLLTGFSTLSFAEPVEELAFYRGAANILSAIAIAGIAQFALQFVGLGLFSFTGLLPDNLLFESMYNLQIPVGIGDALKSNGFFLLEPSIFSQAMAMGTILEILAARRPWVLAVFIGGLVLSFSGTGWIVLGSFLISVGLRLGGRGMLIGVCATVGLLLIAILLMLFVPEAASVFGDRVAEFSQPGTSGNMRFATPFTVLHDVLAHEDWAWLFGVGAGVSEKLDLAYEYDVNTPIKIIMEFGIPGLLLYFSLFIKAARTQLQSAMLVPALVLIIFAGGYQEFAPVLFPIFLLICVARLRPASSLADATDV
jgi:hypothetical protein